MNTKPPQDNTPPEDNPHEHSGPSKGGVPAEAADAGSFGPATDESLSAYLDGEATAQEARQIEADPELLDRVAQFRAASRQVAGPVFEKQRTEIIATAMTEYDQLYKTTRGSGVAESGSEEQATAAQNPSGNKKSVFFNDGDDTKKASFWRSPARSRALGLTALLIAGFLAYGMLRLVDNGASDDMENQRSAVAASIAYSSLPDLKDAESSPAAGAYPTTTVSTEALSAPTTVAADATTTTIEGLTGVEVPAISSGGEDATTEIIIPPASLPQVGADCDNHDSPGELEPTTTTSAPTTTTVAETESDRDPEAATATTTTRPAPAPALEADSGAGPGSNAPVTTIPSSDTTTTAPPTTIPTDASSDGPNHSIPPAIISPGPLPVDADIDC